MKNSPQKSFQACQTLATNTQSTDNCLWNENLLNDRRLKSWREIQICIILTVQSHDSLTKKIGALHFCAFYITHKVIRSNFKSNAWPEENAIQKFEMICEFCYQPLFVGNGLVMLEYWISKVIIYKSRGETFLWNRI